MGSIFDLLLYRNRGKLIKQGILNRLHCKLSGADDGLAALPSFPEARVVPESTGFEARLGVVCFVYLLG